MDIRIEPIIEQLSLHKQKRETNLTIHFSYNGRADANKGSIINVGVTK